MKWARSASCFIWAQLQQKIWTSHQWVMLLDKDWDKKSPTSIHITSYSVSTDSVLSNPVFCPPAISTKRAFLLLFLMYVKWVSCDTQYVDTMSRASLAETSLSKPIRKADDEHRQYYNIYTGSNNFFCEVGGNAVCLICREKLIVLSTRSFP